MHVDWPVEDLRRYQPERDEPSDFDDFWAATLTQARERAVPARFTPHDVGLATVDVHDVTFAGQPVRGCSWCLVAPVEYIGYNGGRGLAHERLFWSAAGYAHFVMDTRGQGSDGSSVGDTGDPDLDGTPQTPGFMTRGVTDPQRYYYRRVFTDAVRAVETVREHPAVDPTRVVVAGGSQGGGITLAVAGLVDGLAAVLPDVPFLCHYRRATAITDSFPYQELVAYCRTHRDQADRVFATLRYFDGVNFAARAGAPALFSVALMDAVCPPSTVFAAYNHYAGEKEITIWPYNGHEGGAGFNLAAQRAFLAKLLDGADM
ncbi:acetylxylan esterase [Dactylosporangium sp. CA-233914]|uniref:acetylxylan esterase n=1 Tax=Dactylosporangium sp. CA-233914 TaxID=3239934 RepID=UPI003D89F38F